MGEIPIPIENILRLCALRKTLKKTVNISAQTRPSPMWQKREFASAGDFLHWLLRHVETTLTPSVRLINAPIAITIKILLEVLY